MFTPLSWIVFIAGTFILRKGAPRSLYENKLYSPTIFVKLLSGALNKTALDSGVFPHYTAPEGGEWNWFSLANKDGWAAGFYPAMMYLLSERQSACDGLAPIANWAALGREWSVPLIQLGSSNTIQSSIGMASYPFQEELKLNPGNENAKNAVISFANALASRFNPTVGALRSVDSSDPSIVTVSIEDIVNIQVLMAAYKLNNNETLKTIAVTHANTTMKQVVRHDGGNYHYVDFKASDGSVIERKYSESFSWGRGQAWGMLGFSQMYQDTQNRRYLDTARNMSNYLVSVLPKSMIVPWNFNSTTDLPTDTSAAMIAAYAYALLAKLDSNPSYASTWLTLARQILNSNVKVAWTPSWESIIGNGTVDADSNPPITGTGTVYGDYYFLKFGNFFLSENYFSCN